MCAYPSIHLSRAGINTVLSQYGAGHSLSLDELTVIAYQYE
jgi:hypothetical protein